MSQVRILGVLRMPQFATLKQDGVFPVQVIKNVLSMDLLDVVMGNASPAAMMRIVVTACAPISPALLNVLSVIQTDRWQRMAAANMNRTVLESDAVVPACIMTIALHETQCVISTETHVVSARQTVNALSKASSALVDSAEYAIRTGIRLT